MNSLLLFISSGLARHESVIDSVVTGGRPRGEEDKEAEKRFLFIKVEVAGGCLICFGCGGQEVGDRLRSSEGWSKGIHSTQRGLARLRGVSGTSASGKGLLGS